MQVVANQNYSKKKDDEIDLVEGLVYQILESDDTRFRVKNAEDKEGWAPAVLLLARDAEGEKTCKLCSKLIIGAFVSTETDVFHKECFTCSICNELLSGKAFVRNEEKIFCEKCYKKTFTKRCAHCKEVLQGSYITALGKDWHSEHFVCTECGKPNVDTFRNYKNQPYCDKCYFIKVIKKCSSCKIVFTDNETFIEISNHKFHKKCFVCEYDKKPLSTDKSVKFNDEKIYCEKHYSEHIVKRCHVCRNPISGKCLTGLGKNYHRNCLNCEECGKNLENADPKVYEGKLVCGPDLLKLKRNREEEEEKQKKKREKAEKEKERQKMLKKRAEEEKKKNAEKDSTMRPFYTLEELQKGDCHPALNRSRVEEYLEPEVFLQLFGMQLKEFKNLPLKRQRELKKVHNLIE